MRILALACLLASLAACSDPAAEPSASDGLVLAGAQDAPAGAVDAEGSATDAGELPDLHAGPPDSAEVDALADVPDAPPELPYVPDSGEWPDTGTPDLPVPDTQKPPPDETEPPTDGGPDANDDADPGGAVADSAAPDGAAPDSVPPPPAVTLITETVCTNPCTFSAVVAGPIVAVQYDGDGWVFGKGLPPAFEVTWSFTKLGERIITASGLGSGGEVLASDTKKVVVESPAAPCEAYTSDEEEYSPVQTAKVGIPPGAADLPWLIPAKSTWTVPFAGVPGKPASHEGKDYVNDDKGQKHVDVLAAAPGKVVYVRLGCPQSAVFTKNTLLRECGAGWGNHVVVRHGGAGPYTRYAHLAPGGVGVAAGDSVAGGAPIGEMGNSGRSDVRHLHLELGAGAAPPDPCAPAQSFDAVYDPALVGL